MVKVTLLVVCSCLVHAQTATSSTSISSSDISSYTRVQHESLAPSVNVSGVLIYPNSQEHMSCLDCAHACKDIGCQTFYYNPSQRLCAVTGSEKTSSSLDLVLDSSWSTYLLENTSNPDPEDRCDHTYLRYVSKCVSFHMEKRTWDQAKIFCTTRGGQLIDFKSSSQFLFFRKLMLASPTLNGSYWHIGLSINSSTKKWTWINTGFEVAKDSGVWQTGEPNNVEGGPLFCAGLLPGLKFFLDDYSCSSTTRCTICQY